MKKDGEGSAVRSRAIADTVKRNCRVAIWPVVLAMAFACPSPMADARQAPSRPTPLPLEILSHADAERAGVAGTGCTWRGGLDRTGRLTMADGRAAVRRGGRLIAMKPATDAKALFLTYDGWVGDGIRIEVHDTGKIVRRGYEFSETLAWIDLTERGRTTRFSGRLNCGS